MNGIGGNASALPVSTSPTAGILPDTSVSGQAPAQIDPATGQPVQVDPATGQPVQQAPAGQLPDMTGMMSKLKWIGPLMAVGGVAMLAMHKGKPWMGVGMGVSGIVSTMMGWNAAGKEKGRVEGAQAVQAIAEQVIAQQTAQFQQILAQVQAQKGTQTAPDPTTQTGIPTVPGGLPTPGVPSTPTQPSTPGVPSSPVTPTQPTTPVAPTQPGTPTQPATPSPTAPALPATQWSASGLIGSGLDLAAGLGSGGQQIADPGRAVLTQVLGDAAGYATFDEADQVARSGISTSVFNTKTYRWIVLEHGGRYFAFQAQIDDSGMGATAPLMPAQNGNLAAWHALKMLPVGSGFQWMQYDWSQTGGAVAGTL